MKSKAKTVVAPTESGETTRAVKLSLTDSLTTRAGKLSVNVSAEVGWRLRKVAFEERLSESSIVEIALEQLFVRTTEATVGKFLREHGASLRRGGA